MHMNRAVSQRLEQLLRERGMSAYQLHMKTNVPKSTIGNLLNCSFSSARLQVLHRLCLGLDITVAEFFDAPQFREQLEP